MTTTLSLPNRPFFYMWLTRTFLVNLLFMSTLARHLPLNRSLLPVNRSLLPLTLYVDSRALYCRWSASPSTLLSRSNLLLYLQHRGRHAYHTRDAAKTEARHQNQNFCWCPSQTPKPDIIHTHTHTHTHYTITHTHTHTHTPLIPPVRCCCW